MQVRTDVACLCATVIHRWSLPGRARHGHGDLARSGMKSPVAPPLMGGLPGDAEPGANLGAGIAMFAAGLRCPPAIPRISSHMVADLR
jgi:hypothetical protein